MQRNDRDVLQNIQKKHPLWTTIHDIIIDIQLVFLQHKNCNQKRRKPMVLGAANLAQRLARWC